ncbi:hypothetical protein BX261_7253 [Streptomyces sp. 2321.6]|uniref:hypothetical protein n=1 Tax=Streptomyces sp. 2321.6 TaxID=1938840 RepID=UPI000BB132EB|nr:hypothetical protein [Streptomyces sp. 2321.6]PBC72380.1 hypothetical protein BX261_7253 [Streptomyces sp. 2321.6]
MDQLQLFPAYTGDLFKLHVGEQLARKDPAVRNATLSMLVCEGHRFPAKCRPSGEFTTAGEWIPGGPSWFVEVADREVAGTYAEVVTAIREHVAAVDPGVFERIAQREAEMARVHAKIEAEIEARRTEVEALHGRIVDAHRRTLDGARRLDDACLDGLVPESVCDWIDDHLMPFVAGAMHGYRRSTSSRPERGTDRIAYLRDVASRMEHAAGEVADAVAHYLLNRPQ